MGAGMSDLSQIRDISRATVWQDKEPGRYVTFLDGSKLWIREEAAVALINFIAARREKSRGKRDAMAEAVAYTIATGAPPISPTPDAYNQIEVMTYKGPVMVNAATFKNRLYAQRRALKKMEAAEGEFVDREAQEYGSTD